MCDNSVMDVVNKMDEKNDPVLMNKHLMISESSFDLSETRKSVDSGLGSQICESVLGSCDTINTNVSVPKKLSIKQSDIPEVHKKVSDVQVQTSELIDNKETTKPTKKTSLGQLIKKKISVPRIHVIEHNDFNNNNCKKENEFVSPDNVNADSCWFHFLSVICFWKMSGDKTSHKVVQTARVQDSETWNQQKRSKFTVYKVVVHSSTSNWFVFRRYAEFHRLYESLKKQIPNLQLKLPGKKLFGNNLDPSFIAMRQDGLDAFVQQIISQPDLLQMPEVREFFQLDNRKHLPNQIIKDDGGDDHNVENSKLNLGTSERCHAKPSDFEFLRVIGQGSFGKVLLTRHKRENRYYAVKVLSKKQVIRKNEAKHIIAERNVLLKNLHHPFLVGLHYSFQTSEKLYFVLDYVNGGELFFHLQKERVFSEVRSRFYTAEIACALGYLHGLGIIYRDLKPENLLLDSQGHVILTDFGLSKEGLVGTDTTKTFCGTPEYLAPEIIRKEEYDKSVDWWCLGTVLYEMLFGLPPFYCRDTSEMYEHILNKPLTFRGPSSANAQDILRKLLEKDSSKRLGSGYGDFDDVKRHLFFKSINWDDLLAKKIKPPYNPHVQGVMDLTHIDPQFTKEQIPASVEFNPEGILSASVREADEIFAGFSYAPPLTELTA